MTDSVYQKAREALSQVVKDWPCNQLGTPYDDDQLLVLRKALDAGEKAEREKDECLLGMTRISEWIDEEREKHVRRGRGGQMVGDSHCPRVPVSVLIELERMLRPGDLKYTFEEIRKLAERAEKAEASMKQLVHQALDCKDLLLDCWTQFAYDVADHPGVKTDGGLSTLEWLADTLLRTGDLERVQEGKEWYRMTSRDIATPPRPAT